MRREQVAQAPRARNGPNKHDQENPKYSAMRLIKQAWKTFIRFESRNVTQFNLLATDITILMSGP